MDLDNVEPPSARRTLCANHGETQASRMGHTLSSNEGIEEETHHPPVGQAVHKHAFLFGFSTFSYVQIVALEVA
jgi:hypothetical protein